MCGYREALEILLDEFGEIDLDDMYTVGICVNCEEIVDEIEIETNGEDVGCCDRSFVVSYDVLLTGGMEDV